MQSSIQSGNSIESYRVYDLQTDAFLKSVNLTQGVSKRKDLMKILNVIFPIKLIPSHL